MCCTVTTSETACSIFILLRFDCVLYERYYLSEANVSYSDRRVSRDNKDPRTHLFPEHRVLHFRPLGNVGGTLKHRQNRCPCTQAAEDIKHNATDVWQNVLLKGVCHWDMSQTHPSLSDHPLNFHLRDRSSCSGSIF